MKVNRALIVAVAAVVLIAAGWWFFGRRGGSAGIDLIDQLPTAVRSPADRSFNVGRINLNGESHQAIEAIPPSRLTWKVRVPDDAWLRVMVGLKPEAWTAEGDGVLFFGGVSDGRTFEKLFEQIVNPFSNPGDRRWIPVMVDLSPYAGEEVSVIFNTRNNADGKPHNPNNDFAVWGAPEILVK